MWNITCPTSVSTSADPIDEVVPILKVMFTVAVLLSTTLGSRRCRAWNWSNPAVENLDAPVSITMP